MIAKAWEPRCHTDVWIADIMLYAFGWVWFGGRLQ